MKYRAEQLSNGNYAVFTGKQYFISTETPDENKAKYEALKMSAIWYYNQAEAAFKEAEEQGLLNKWDDCLGEWLC